MGNFGRACAVAVPYLLTIGALGCLLSVQLGSVKADQKRENSIYFLRADLSNLADADVSTKLTSMASAAIKNLTQANQLLSDLQTAEKDAHIRDFYDIGLWGYCTGDKTHWGDFDVDYCSPAKAMFSFDPETVWGLNGTGADALFPSGLKNAISKYQNASRWMFITYMVATISTGAELLVGISALFSRWGSFATTLISCVSTTFTILASITSTAIFATLDSNLNNTLKEFGLSSKLGLHMFLLTWFAVILSIGSGLIWSFTSCCCSPQSRTRTGQYIVKEKSQYTYERVSSPYQGQSSAAEPMIPMEARPLNDTPPDAYEPFRHTDAEVGA